MICDKCGDYGFLQQDEGPMGIPQAIPCECRVEKILNQQAEKAWTGLSELPLRQKTSLSKVIEKSAIISADKSALTVNLRTALWLHRKPYRFVKVVSDATLMSAWLSNISLSNSEIYDPDFQRDIKAGSLEDLAESPDLLIIRLGVKMARNSAMPEVLGEAIELRRHLNKPTWVVCEPDKPLEEGHISWSRAVEEMLEGWPILKLSRPVQKSDPENSSEDEASEDKKKTKKTNPRKNFDL